MRRWLKMYQITFPSELLVLFDQPSHMLIAHGVFVNCLIQKTEFLIISVADPGDPRSPTPLLKLVLKRMAAEWCRKFRESSGSLKPISGSDTEFHSLSRVQKFRFVQN